MPNDSLIKYPTDFPIKIMGTNDDAFVQTMIALVKEHDPSFHKDKVEIRPSAKGNYLSLTATVWATSRDQLDNLYRALSSHAMVKIVL